MVQESLNQEIKWLESQLEAKKKELGGGVENKEEKEIVRDVFKEAASTNPPAFPQTSQNLSDDDAKKAAHELEEKKHHEIIEGLIKTALAKNISSAVKIANSLRNPHLLDDFHDALADEYYQKLLESRKIRNE